MLLVQSANFVTNMVVLACVSLTLLVAVATDAHQELTDLAQKAVKVDNSV